MLLFARALLHEILWRKVVLVGKSKCYKKADFLC